MRKPEKIQREENLVVCTGEGKDTERGKSGSVYRGRYKMKRKYRRRVNRR